MDVVVAAGGLAAIRSSVWFECRWRGCRHTFANDVFCSVYLPVPVKGTFWGLAPPLSDISRKAVLTPAFIG